MNRILDYFEVGEILDFLNEGLLYADIDGTITAINRAGARTFGYAAPEEIIGTNLRERMRMPEDVDTFTDIIKKTGEINDFLILALKRDGKYAYLEAQSRLIRDGEGLPAGTTTIFRDISEREIHRRALERAEARYQELFSGLSEGYARFTPDGTVIFINPAGAKILGFDSPLQMTGGKITDLWENPQEGETYLKRLLRDGYAVRVPLRIRTSAGEARIIEMSERLVTGRDGQIVGADALFRDVTGEAALKAELKERLKLYRHIVHEFNELVLSVDRDLKIIRINDAVTRILGYTDEDARGRSIYEFVISEDHPVVDPARMRMQMNNEIVRDVTVRVMAKNGETLPLSWTGVPISPPMADGTNIILIAANISELVSLQERTKKLGEGKAGGE